MGQPLTGRPAVLAPGGGYGPDGPLLMYSRLAITRRGGAVRPVSWQFALGADFAERRADVAAQVESAIDELTAAVGSAPLLIGKSLGSLAAPVAAARGLPAVWFTPILNDEQTVAALRRATAPYLLVGGTADKFWDGRTARSLSTDLVEIQDADHGMFIPGRLAASAVILGQVITAVEDFIDRLPPT